jgi:hypothetical protein
MSTLLLLLALSERAGAVLPLPTYPQCGEEDREDLCPSDLDEEWWEISYIPDGSRDTVRPEELDIGSGNHADRAWRTTTGRTDVVLAVLDSGMDWAESRYKNKILLNPGELPLPELADGSTATTWDVDGNGIVNIQDYAADPRVAIDAGRDISDFMLDGSDLLATFSDGVDDDGNGFVDDIAGWDFFADDNDPYHEYNDDFGTHGSGVIEDMANEGGDEEDGSIGQCPNCAVLPVRIGDTFVTDGSRVAMGIAYAVDRGAIAVNLSVGALTNPDAAIAAAAWARKSGASIVGAAGDENAYHHNFPAMMDGILYVHSIHSNTDDENSGTYSYLNFFNCNNYGPRITLVADSPACATGATAITTGTVGLVQSAARDAGLTLTPDEVYQVLIQTVDDVNLSAADVASAATYPSGEGWDPFYGYGRIDAGRAVEMVAAGDIPPAMDISSPSWFETIDPGVGTVDIDGYIAADRSASYTYTIEYGLGDDPRTWTELTSGSGTSRLEGTLATLDLSQIDTAAMTEADRRETILGRMDRVFAPAVTVRIRVTDAEGHVGQFQKTFFVYPDPDMLAGFPLDMGSSGESSPILTDLDDDGVDEIVIADASGRVHAYEGTGEELAGWPVVTDANPHFHQGEAAYVGGDLPLLHEGMIATVAVGDVDGDGSPEVFGATGSGSVYGWHADGTPLAGYPVHIEGRTPEEFDSKHVYDNGFAGAPALYDLDGDGTLEVIAAAMDQRLYVWDASGAPWGPYPIEICAAELCGQSGTRIITTPAVGDVDGDGEVEIGLGTNETVNDGHSSISYLLDAVSGVMEPGWPVDEGGLINEAGLLPIVGEGHPASMAFADIDGDGTLEIASPVMFGQSPLYKYDGTVARDLSYVSSGFGADNNTDQPSFSEMTDNPAFGDMTGDGVPDYVIGAVGSYYLIALPLITAIDWQNVVAAWDGATGEALPGWPRQIEDLQFLVAPAVADLDDDGKAEAIMGSAGYLMHAWDAAGEEPEGWPKFTGNWILGSPAVGDIDGDGWLEVVVSTREGHLFAWHTKGPADQDIGWASIHHDPQNTGNYETPLVKQQGPERAEEEIPQGCCTGGSKASLLWLMPLGLLWRRRRS